MQAPQDRLAIALQGPRGPLVGLARNPSSSLLYGAGFPLPRGGWSSPYGAGALRHLVSVLGDTNRVWCPVATQVNQALQAMMAGMGEMENQVREQMLCVALHMLWLINAACGGRL